MARCTTEAWKYEGSLELPSKASLCYWAPFDFNELDGIDWYLAIESDGNRSCLLGAHPDAQSSLWQISPDGDVWLKRQGKKIAIVEEDSRGMWKLTEEVPMPELVDHPSEAIFWSSDNQLTLLAEGQLWTMDRGETWQRLDVPKLDVTGFMDRGFVQTQSYIYFWGEDKGLLIHKRSGRIQRILNDNWPDLLIDFEQLGTIWHVEGDEVSVRNEKNELVFDLRQKEIFSNDLLFRGIQFSEEEGKDFANLDIQGILSRLLASWPLGIALSGFLLGIGIGVFGFFTVSKRWNLTGQRGHDSGVAIAMDEEVVSDFQLSGLSDSFKSLVLLAPGVLSTEEFDQAIKNGVEQSPESQRSRRSKVIRDVNNEAQLVIGYDLIERDRDQSDRRKLMYRIKAVPNRLVRKVANFHGHTALDERGVH